MDDPKVEALVRALTAALRERLEREDGRIEEKVAAAMAIGRHFAALPVPDARSPDELLDYDERGLPR